MPSGTAVFSRVTYPAGTVIFEVTGDIVYKSDLQSVPVAKADNYIQIGKDFYLGLSGQVDDYVNHSCNPNCYVRIVGARAFFTTLYQINAGDEITYDYSTTCNETREEWSWPCRCGLFTCRKIISGFQYLDEKRKEEYRKQNIIPDYLK